MLLVFLYVLHCTVQTAAPGLSKERPREKQTKKVDALVRDLCDSYLIFGRLRTTRWYSVFITHAHKVFIAKNANKEFPHPIITRLDTRST